MPYKLIFLPQCGHIVSFSSILFINPELIIPVGKATSPLPVIASIPLISLPNTIIC